MAAGYAVRVAVSQLKRRLRIASTCVAHFVANQFRNPDHFHSFCPIDDKL
jgi:hypothetical protein